MTLTNPITATALRADLTAVLTSLAGIDGTGINVSLYCATLADTTALRDRTLAWTQQDDATLEYTMVRATDGTASRVVTAVLSVDSGDTIYLGEQTISATVTTVNGTADTRTSYTTVTGTRVRLLRGVRYRMTLANTSAGTTISGPVIFAVQMRALQRRT